MKILITGADGFLGWHTRVVMMALTDHEVVPVDREKWGQLPGLVAECDAVIHVAGVNRGTNDSVIEGNVSLARELAAALTVSGRGKRLVYANTVQVGNGSPYGTAKEEAGRLLAEASETSGGSFVDVRLPNLFGEHGRPDYNSFVATFVAAIVAGDEPTITDNEVALLYVQEAALALIEGLTGTPGIERPQGQARSVRGVWDLLQEFDHHYTIGEIPDLSTPFRVSLFNTYRAAKFLARPLIPLMPHSDDRGSFVETTRCCGGGGQTSFSTTVPGVVRGDHFHLRKVERFVVLSGTGRIQVRKLFSTEVMELLVTGNEPVAVDMPIGWAHNISNVGDDILVTQFWAHELFSMEDPDTYPSPVATIEKG